MNVFWGFKFVMSSGVHSIIKRAIFLPAVLSCVITNPVVHAASFTKTMNVKLSVASVCALNVANMDFGTLTKVVGTETASSYVSVVCNQLSTVYLSFLPTFSVANTGRTSSLTSVAGDTINFSMQLRGYFGTLGAFQTGFTYIDGKLAATPGVKAGTYQSTETLYVIY